MLTRQLENALSDLRQQQDNARDRFASKVLHQLTPPVVVANIAVYCERICVRRLHLLRDRSAKCKNNKVNNNIYIYRERERGCNKVQACFLLETF